MKNYIKAFSILAILFFSCSSRDKSAVNSYLGFDIPKDSISSYIDSKMTEYNINGISIAIINKGEVVYHHVKGYANTELKRVVTKQTIFEGASISKPVFSFFVMTFVEEGLLDLDKPLYQYLPNDAIAYDERYKKITSRMVLSHRSGFQNWREDDEDKTLKIQFEPGTDYFYSGEGYQYLAEVLKHLLKTDWNGLEAEFQKRIAKPIGMENTVFIENEYTKRYKAEPYDENNEWIDWKNNYWSKKDDGIFSAPASIHSESIDFSKWMIAVMNNGILKEESYNELLKPHSKVPYDGFDVSYTLGFVTPHIPFTNVYMHGGNNIGFTSSFALDTEKNWGYVLFTNSEYGEKLGEEFLLYMFAGPDKTKLYLTIAFILVSLSIVLRYVFKRLKRKLKAV